MQGIRKLLCMATMRRSALHPYGSLYQPHRTNFKGHLYVLYLSRILPHVFSAVNENQSDVEGRKQLLHIVPALLHRADDELHLLRVAHDVLKEAAPLLAISGIDRAQELFHLLLDGDFRQMRLVNLMPASRHEHGIAEERNVSLELEALLDLFGKRFRSGRLAVDDEDARRIGLLDRRQPIEDLIHVGVRGNVRTRICVILWKAYSISSKKVM